MKCVCLLLLCSLMTFTTARNLTVEEKIRDDSDLSQFYSLLERNHIANNSLTYRQVTLFAPTNQAFQKYSGVIDESLVLYHITNLALTLDQLGHNVLSELEGNPPLWVTRRRGLHRDDIYINNALLLKHRSNYISTNSNNKRQVLHVIDDVLVPLMSSQTSGSDLYNPDAHQFLTQSESLAIDQHRVRSFRQKVVQNKKDYVYKADGRHTFFIPVDEGFKPPPRPEMIDKKVIDGHVIPNHVLFTHPTPNDEPYQTLAFEDNLKVTVSFSTNEDGTKTYVKSNTLLGDPKHASGVVLAEIVKANIPVKNGVVHLIHRPLMVVDTTVTQFLEEKEDGPLYKFYEVIMDVGGEFMRTINRKGDITLFAPSNEAWSDANLKNLIRNKEKLREILNLHLVSERLPLDKILQNNMNQVPTAADRKNLYFNVINRGVNQTLTVEGGGVNATVIQPNIAATNGIVHIIDRVLGVPYTTVQEKLRTDPMLNDTYFLGQRSGFNEQLNDTTRRFTYFVPRDMAWQGAETEYPSAHKKLFMRDFAYHTRQILERHLVIADQAYTISDLKFMANQLNDSLILPTVRDSLQIRIREFSKSYFIEWQNERIPIFRPDVECTNGIIHVIDKPFLKDSDIRVTGAASVIKLCPHIFTLMILNWLLL